MEIEQTERTIESLVKEHGRYGKLAAGAIIKRNRTFARAKAKGENAFKEFCEQVNCKHAASTTRKYLEIGLEADWLLPMADLLPPEWTTIYLLAVLGQTKVEALLQRGVLHPRVTAKNIRAAIELDVPPEKPHEATDVTEAADALEPTPEVCVLKVDATALPDGERTKLFLNLQMAADQHGLVVIGLPDRLAQELVSQREAA